MQSIKELSGSALCDKLELFVKIHDAQLHQPSTLKPCSIGLWILRQSSLGQLQLCLDRLFCCLLTMLALHSYLARSDLDPCWALSQGGNSQGSALVINGVMTDSHQKCVLESLAAVVPDAVHLWVLFQELASQCHGFNIIASGCSPSQHFIAQPAEQNQLQAR